MTLDLRPHAVPLIGLLAIGVLCYGFAAVNLTLFGDDWAMLHDSSIAYLGLGSGRWLSWAIWHLSAENAFMPLVTLAVGVMFLGLSALVIGDLFKLDTLSNLTFMLLYVSAPFLVEPFTFNIGQVAIGLSMLTAALGVQLMFIGLERHDRRQALGDLALGGAALVATAAIYQTSAITAAILIALKLLVDSRYHAIRSLVRALLVIAATTVLSGIVYFISVRVSWLVTDSGPLHVARYDITQGYASLPQLIARIRELGVIWGDYVTGNVHAHFAVTKMLLLLLCVVAFAMLAWTAGRRSHMAIFVIPAVGFILLVAPFSLNIIRTEYDVRYNTLVPLGAMLALLPALLLSRIEKPLLRFVVSAALAVIVIANIFAHNIVSVGRLLIFERDLAIAERIIGRIEAGLEIDEIGGEVPVRLVGHLPMNAQARPFGDGDGPLPGQNYFRSSIAECSVFNCQTNRFFSAAPLIQGGVTYVMARGRIPPDSESAIASMPSWPHRDSVAKVGSEWVIKLSP